MNKRTTFNGSLGFVLAAAGSAVGLGNIWRFPNLAAKDGGGIFVAVYLVLALTFGFALLSTEVAIGRKMKLGPLSAYSKLKSGWRFLGVLACVVPFLILPYYCVIGGWVLKYLCAFITGKGGAAAADGYFGGFISGTSEPIIMFLIFLIAVVVIVLLGVNKGIELSSKIIMPVLLLLVIIISIFSMTISHTETVVNGAETQEVTRTGLEGLKVLFVPDFSEMTFGKFLTVVVDAMGQLFYSLSIAMGIMIAYGSYVDDGANLSKSINHIEWFDTAVAILAGVMIIPAVYTFMGPDKMKEVAGPGLMFVTLPKVFAEMGVIGNVVGIMFFGMVLFAALSSAVSVMEAIVSSFMDEFHLSRKKAGIIESVIALILGVIVCLGFNKFSFEIHFPNDSSGGILDIMDYVSNLVLMPIVAIATCVLVGWVVGTNTITDEITKNNETFRRRALYNVMIKFIAPVLLFVLFLKALGVIKM